MFYLYELPREKQGAPITLDRIAIDDFANAQPADRAEGYGDEDVDFVDDSLLNTAPHNKIEQQLLRGDVVGLALMSGAILWSAMGAFG